MSSQAMVKYDRAFLPHGVPYKTSQENALLAQKNGLNTIVLDAGHGGKDPR